MEKTTKPITSSIIAVLLVAAALIGGIYYLATRQPGETGPLYSPPQTSRQPAAPTAETRSATLITQSTALLNGTVNPNGAQTSFWHEYGRDETLGNRSAIQLLGSGYANFSAPSFISGLAPNTTYYFRIGAQNQIGVVYGSILTFTTSAVTATPPQPPRIGRPPETLTNFATSVTENSATLTGSINPNGYQTYYWFEYGEAPSLGNVTSVESAGSGTANVSVSASLSNLKPNTVYYHRLNAQNVWGTVNGPIFSFVTKPGTPPPPPAGQAPSVETDPASNIARTSATINGRLNPLGTQTNYWFEYGRATLPGVFDLDSRTTTRSAGSGMLSMNVSASISNLEANTTYHYRLVAENQFGRHWGAILLFTTTK